MAATRGQKVRLSRDLGMFFAELGFIPGRKEYSFMSNRPKHITVKEIDRIAGSWSSAITMIQREHRELWDMIHTPVEVKQEKPVVKAPNLKIDPPKVPEISLAKPAKAEKKGE